MKQISQLALCLWWVLASGFVVLPAFGEVSVKSGGVGLEDRAEEPSYSIKLVFFEKSTPQGGPYVSNVKVAIYTEGYNSVVDVVSTGPWLFVDLPEGKYRVQATRKSGQSQSVIITATNKQRTISIGFDAE